MKEMEKTKERLEHLILPLTIITMFVPCIIEDVQIITAPTNTQFYHYVYHC